MCDVFSKLNDVQPSRKRLRFSLKTAFILLTLIAVWFGVYEFRVCQADAVAMRAAAIYESLDINIVTPPNGTTLNTQPSTGFRQPMLNRHIIALSGLEIGIEMGPT